MSKAAFVKMLMERFNLDLFQMRDLIKDIENLFNIGKTSIANIETANPALIGKSDNKEWVFRMGANYKGAGGKVRYFKMFIAVVISAQTLGEFETVTELDKKGYDKLIKSLDKTNTKPNESITNKV